MLILVGAAHAQTCCGDCNGDRAVSINELVTAVNNALDGCAIGSPCCGDCDGNGDVTIAELVRAVGDAFDDCVPDVSLPTPTPAPATRCILPFDEDAGGHFCRFVGTFCGRPLEVWSVPAGAFVSIALTAPHSAQPPYVFVTGSSQDATHAELSQWYTSATGLGGILSGTAELSDDGLSLTVDITSPAAFSIDGCPFDGMTAVYVGIL